MEYQQIFAKYILNTPPKARVILYDAFVYSIPPDVYISTKSLKHAYDRRPEDTKRCLDRIYDAFQNPDYLVQARGDQKGRVLFLKRFEGDKFLVCPAEVYKKEGKSVLFCVSFFLARMAYIKKFTILWSREAGGIPPS